MDTERRLGRLAGPAFDSHSYVYQISDHSTYLHSSFTHPYRPAPSKPPKFLCRGPSSKWDHWDQSHFLQPHSLFATPTRIILTNISSHKMDTETPLKLLTQEFVTIFLGNGDELGWEIFLQSNILWQVLEDDYSVLILKK